MSALSSSKISSIPKHVHFSHEEKEPSSHPEQSKKTHKNLFQIISELHEELQVYKEQEKQLIAKIVEQRKEIDQLKKRTSEVAFKNKYVPSTRLQRRAMLNHSVVKTK